MGKKNVVIVEDEVLIADNIGKKLKRMGFLVEGTFQSGSAALDYIKDVRPPPDLILMDILLDDGEDGIEVASEIHRTTDIPIIFLSALDDHQTIQRATAAAKPFNYLVKPFSDPELQTTIEIAFQRAELEKKLKESEKRYKIVSELSSDFAYAVHLNIDGGVKVEWVTEAVTNITGYTVEEIIRGIDYLSLIPDEEQRYVKRLMNAVVKGESRCLEHRIIGKDGTIHWVRNKARPETVSKDGGVTKIYGSVEEITELKRIEQIEKSKEQNFQALIKRMNDGVVILDQKGVITFVNDLLCSMTGYEKYELIGEHVHALSGKADTSLPVNNTSEDIPFETTCRTKQGDDVNILVSPKTLHDGKGNFAGSFSVITNIDKQKEKEYYLRKQREVSQSQYENIFQNIGIALIEQDFTGVQRLLKEKQKKVKDLPRYIKRYPKFLSKLFAEVRIKNINDAAVDLLEIKDPGEYKERFQETLLPETVDFIRNGFIDLLNGKRRVTGEVPICTGEGNVIYIAADLLLPENSEGLKMGLLSLMDVTEKYDGKYTLKGDDLFREIVDASPEALVVSDENRNILYVSKKTLKLFGFPSREEIVGKSIIAWIAREEQLRAIENIKKVYQGVTNVNTYTLIRADGTEFGGEIISSVIADSSGEHKKMVSILRETT